MTVIMQWFSNHKHRGTQQKHHLMCEKQNYTFYLQKSTLTLNKRMQSHVSAWCLKTFYFSQKKKAMIECHPFAGLYYRATTHSACQIYNANTAGHITSPTSKAASWKAQKILAEIYSPHLYASETCWSKVISLPLSFFVFHVKLANTLMSHFQNFYTCEDKSLQPQDIKPSPLLMIKFFICFWKSYNQTNQNLSHCLSDLYKWRVGRWKEKNPGYSIIITIMNIYLND